MSVVVRNLIFWFLVSIYFVAILYTNSVFHAFFATIYLYLSLYFGKKYSGDGTWADVFAWIRKHKFERVQIVISALSVCVMTVIFQGNKNYLEVALFFVHAVVFFWSVMVVGARLRLKWDQRSRSKI